MRNSVLAALLVAALFSVTLSVAVHAGSEFSSGSMTGRSMMGGGGMMSRMPRMMGGCSAIMRGGSHGGRPNEQWRDERSPPDRDR